ncbi:MAG TPA: hypothetical protein VFQ20_07340 [Burkholderiaceae bacterium]|nr:hypothetical protein [Burkholderiaceae bacterium]
MKRSAALLTLTASFGLVACNPPPPAVVAVPAPVPGPPGATGATGATGNTGKAGDGTTVIIVEPPASAPSR